MNNDTLLIQRSTMPVDRVVAGNDKISIVNPRSITYLKAFGKCEQRNLPPEYTQLEYIESTGTQYIDTGVNIGENIQTKVKFGKTTNSFTKFGFIIGGGGHYQGLVTRTSQNSYYMSMYNSSQNTVVITMPDDVFEVTFNTPEHKVIINNTDSFDLVLISPYEINTTIGVFNTPNTSGNIGIGKVYSFVIKDNSSNSIVSNLIPAKNASNIVGMYDTVSGQFFTNAGTGDFIAGPNTVPTPDKPVDIVCNNGVLKTRHQSGLPLGYTLLDYIESTGTQYIDTGLTAGSNTRVLAQYKVINTGFIFPISVRDQNTTGAGFGIGINGTQQFISDYNGSRKVFTTLTPNTTDIITVDKNGNTCTVTIGDTSETVSNTASTFTTTNTLPIFAQNQAGTISPGQYIFYNFKMWNNEILVRNFIPAKNSNNVVGMYDLVSGQFFTNAGTGDFIAGNEVSDPVKIYTDGTVETINVHGKNLFDATKATTSKLINDSGSIISDSASAYSDYIKAEYNKSYTVSFSEQPSSSAFYTRIHMYDRNKVWIGMAGKSDSAGQQTFSATISNPDCYYIRVSSSKDVNLEQVEEGVENTAYESYYSGGDIICENLLSIGDYIDYQEILSGNIYRNVGIRVLDGTETWSEKDQYGRVSTSVSGIKQGSVRTIQLYCNYFENLYHSEPIENVVAGKFYSSVNNIYFHITQNNVEDFKSWLSQQYTAGTPVIIVYPLASPIEEFAESQSITPKSGTNIIEVIESEIDNLDLEIRYRQK